MVQIRYNTTRKPPNADVQSHVLNCQHFMLYDASHFAVTSLLQHLPLHNKRSQLVNPLYSHHIFHKGEKVKNNYCCGKVFIPSQLLFTVLLISQKGQLTEVKDPAPVKKVWIHPSIFL